MLFREGSWLKPRRELGFETSIKRNVTGGYPAGKVFRYSNLATFDATVGGVQDCLAIQGQSAVPSDAALTALLRTHRVAQRLLPVKPRWGFCRLMQPTSLSKRALPTPRALLRSIVRIIVAPTTAQMGR